MAPKMLGHGPKHQGKCLDMIQSIKEKSSFTLTFSHNLITSSSSSGLQSMTDASWRSKTVLAVASASAVSLPAPLVFQTRSFFRSQRSKNCVLTSSFGNQFVCVYLFAFLWHRPRNSTYKTMNWFKAAAAQAAAAVNQVEAKLQESGASQKLANVAVANETRSLF